MWRERGGKKKEDIVYTLYLSPDIGILALRCILQLPMLKLLQTREGLQSYSGHLYSVSLLETNEPCS